MKRNKQTMRGIGALALLLAMLLVLSACAAAPQAAEAPAADEPPAAAETPAAQSEESWDASYDVIVVGYGASGAVSAIEAADNGAKVLLCDKAPEGQEGGCSRFADQMITCTDDADTFYEYLVALREDFSYPSDSVLRLYADGAAKNVEYLKYLGATDDMIEYGSRGADLSGLPGAECVSVNKVVPSYYLLLQDNVEQRAENIEVWLESPGKKLIQDGATKKITGVEIEKDGKLLRVEAKNGVILACGGFEANSEMVENYLWVTDTYARASQYNTGDGIKMAQAVGADLVNMGVISGYSWVFLSPESGLTSALNSAIRNNIIYVDGTGSRFLNERGSARRGNTLQSGYWRPPVTPSKIYCIFDETTRLAGNVFAGFSADNSAEIEKGWIVKGDTLEELGEKIGVGGEALAATVTQYNEMAKTGDDYIFGRAADRMVAIENGPYYAV